VTEIVIDSPNFSVEAFFYFLFVMMVVSLAAFATMDLLPSMKKFHDVRQNDEKSKDLDEELSMIEKSK
jgi:hypothetical protein